MSVLVVLEQHRMSWEAFAAAQQFAQEMGTTLEAVVVASQELATQAATKKAAKIYSVEHPALTSYTADAYTAALEALVLQAKPTLVVFPHTYQTRDYAPKLATRFGCALISDVVAARFERGAPVFVRQFFQGKFNGDVRPNGDAPHFVSLQAGAWRADALEAGSAAVEKFAPELDASRFRQKAEPPFRESARAVDLTAAEIIVAVGRGIKEKDNIPVVEELAKALGAELAASRPICDAGWLPMERQVGSSGQTVSPKVYIAVGISGAIQHLVGMKGSKIIVAINKDANAPIFEVADYGIAGDLFEVVPALVQEIRKVKS